MTTLDNVQAALSAANMPITARELYDVNDHFDDINDLSKALSKLVKTGRAKVCGMTSPPKGNARKLYQAVAEKNDDDDLDRQLAEAILERDQETAEAVIEPIIGACHEPEAVIEPHTERLVIDDDRTSGLRVEKLPERRYSLAQLGIETTTDPSISEIEREGQALSAALKKKGLIQQASLLLPRAERGIPFVELAMPRYAEALTELCAAVREMTEQ